MKQTGNKSFLVALLLTGFIITASGQGNVIKINILSPVVKTFNIQYEKKLKSDASFQLGFFYTGYSVSGTDFSGFGITPEYRFPPTDRGISLTVLDWLKARIFDFRFFFLI